MSSRQLVQAVAHGRLTAGIDSFEACQAQIIGWPSGKWRSPILQAQIQISGHDLRIKGNGKVYIRSSCCVNVHKNGESSYQHAQYSLRASFFPALLLCAATASDGLGSSLLAFNACSNMPASKNPSNKTLAQHQSQQNLSTYIRLAHHHQVLQNLSLASACPPHQPCLFQP